MKKVFSLFFAALFLLSAAAEGNLVTIKELNTNYTVNSHVNEEFTTASLERSYRESLTLSSATTGYSRYDMAYYPRVKKLKDDLYLMTFMYGQIGTHLYWCTSSDGVHWSSPEYLYQSVANAFTYEYGPKAGATDKFCGVNADVTLLDNGELLCVYYLRLNNSDGRIQYPEFGGIWSRRGTIDKDNKITWGEPQRIYTGGNWEPFIWQRDDGRIEVYFSCGSYYMRKYGYDADHRAGGIGMVWSDDGGYTWTPNVQPGDTNYYQPFMVFSQYVGRKTHTEAPEAGILPWYSAQMPAATRLYNGKTLLAAEVKTLDPMKFTVGMTVSADGGVWEEDLQNGATTNGSDYRENFTGAGPYLATFPSGEVYLAYHNDGTKRFYGRMIRPDGKEYDEFEFRTVPDGYGMWTCCELVGSHEVITAAQKLDKATSISGLILEHSYLNHRTNAKALAVTVDGSAAEWKQNTDAYFIGSATQAQMTVQTAYDKDNLYFLVNRLDNYLTAEDAVEINVSPEDFRFYRISVGMDGAVTVSYVDCGATKNTASVGNASVKVYGTVGNNADIDEGVLYEISVPRSVVGMQSKDAFAISPILYNCDAVGVTKDTMSGVGGVNTSRWPTVILDE